MPKGQLDPRVMESLEKHSLWLKGDPRGECINLSGLEISDVDLSGFDLRRAIMHDVSLKSTSFNSADLRGAVISWSLMNDCNIDGALLLGADLTWTDTAGTAPAYPVAPGDLVTVLDGSDTPGLLIGFLRSPRSQFDRKGRYERVEILLPDGQRIIRQSAHVIPSHLQQRQDEGIVFL